MQDRTATQPPALSDIIGATNGSPPCTMVRLDGQELTGLNARGARLDTLAARSATLDDADLTDLRVHFETTAPWSTLRRADLTGADLGLHATLTGADLTDATMDETNLLGAAMQAVTATRLRARGAQLMWANLDRADLRGADLTGADFTSASLMHADLRGAILTDADFTDADLTGSRLEGAMTHDETLPPRGDESPARFDTREAARAVIRTDIEAGDATAEEYDVEAIIEATTTADGQGYLLTATAEEYQQAVKAAGFTVRDEDVDDCETPVRRAR